MLAELEPGHKVDSEHILALVNGNMDIETSASALSLSINPSATCVSEMKTWDGSRISWNHKPYLL